MVGLCCTMCHGVVKMVKVLHPPPHLIKLEESLGLRLLKGKPLPFMGETKLLELVGQYNLLFLLCSFERLPALASTAKQDLS